MRRDGYYSDAGLGGRRRRRREICRSFTCISPWFIFCRWFNGGKSRGSRSSRLMETIMEGNLDIDKKTGRAKGSRNYEASSSSREDVSAQIGKGASFNIGVGFGLICLVAARRNELNKIVELHKKIELLLQNLQTEFPNQEKKQNFMPSKSSISSSFSKTGVHETPYVHEHDHSGQYLQPEIETGFISDRCRRDKSLRMDQLEAELEAEFDRLQLKMDPHFCLNYSNQQYSEINVEDSAPEWSFNTGLEEVVHQQEWTNGDDEYYGVPPRELERKLHELLEERQQERINELESALEYAMEQLEEKEREVSWWKDTSRLISQNLPAIASLLRQMKQPVYSPEPEFEVKERRRSLVIKELHM